MYTPQEVSEKTFPKSTGLTSGYNMTAVDEFLDGLTEDYTALYKDNTTLKAKLKMLAEKVEEYRATEDAMRSTLLAAQKMAAQMVADAQAEKEKTTRCPGPGGADPCRRPGRGGCPGPAAPAGDPGFLGEAGNGPERDGGLHPAQPGPVRPAAGVSGFSAGAQCPGAGGPGAGERGGDPARPGGERRARGGRGACFPGGGPPAGVCRRTGAAAGVSGEERGGVSLPPGFQAESGGPAVWPQLQRRRPAVNHSVKSGPAAAFALSARRWQYDAHRGPAV